LVRTRPGPKGEKNWLLFKSRDEFARSPGDALLAEQTESALTGRTMNDIAAGRGGKPDSRRVWQSNRAESPKAAAKAPRRGKTKPGLAMPSGAKTEKLPDAVEPELATLVDAAPDGDDWLHELKFDGYRVLARLDRGKVTLLTRRGNDW